MTWWLAVACLLTQQLLAGADDYKENGWWMDQPYSSRSDFNYQVEYTHNHTLKCEDEFTAGLGYSVEYWVKPDMTVMTKGYYETFKTLDGEAGWYVNDDWELEIFITQEEHFGFYHCVVYSAPDTYVIKKAVNYKGAYFGDLWDVYRLNVIIGCSAAAGFLVACIVILVVHHFFFDHGPDGDKYADERSSLNSVVATAQYEDLKRNPEMQSYENATYGEKNGGFSKDTGDEEFTAL